MINEHTQQHSHCDIFCNVIDNYGDIGVCWRLARQLQHEYRLQVRLWIDDLDSFAKLCPMINTHIEQQFIFNIEIRLWSETFPDVTPADLVIEAFACDLPENYVYAMVKQPPVWINLEYLSAEGWVEGCHLLPSPHPTLPLKKYFFFPGFTQQTGGLLLEQNLLSNRDAYDPQLFWHKHDLPTPPPNALKISLFCYPNKNLASLFDIWSRASYPIVCLVPEGKIVPQIQQYFQGAELKKNSLQVHIMPFVEQPYFDELLWACDVNFVRGEDSCVRAQWAGKPFVWHIYPQHDGVHQDKLNAFLKLYNNELDFIAGLSLQTFWQYWNSEQNSYSLLQAWSELMIHRAELDAHAQHWAQKLAKNNLALNLLNFAQKIGTIRAFQN